MQRPFHAVTRTVISFSGGRTSAYMLWRYLQEWGGSLPEHIAVVFTNTGKERPETLDFIERCAQRWGVKIVWLEYRRWTSHPGDAEGRYVTKPRKESKSITGFEVVDYTTADRNGRPFEEVIAAKGMLPNVAIRLCTQWMKIKTSWRYARNMLGWKEYENAIGLRYDEPTRTVKEDQKSTPGEIPIMPLKAARISTSDVMAFWKEQRGGLDLDEWLSLPKNKRPGWDLELRTYEGNCDLCFLKGQGKLLRIMREQPQLAPWWIEREVQFVGKTDLFEAARFRKSAPSYQATLNLSQQPSLFNDSSIDDGPSVSCRCTD